MKNVTLVPIVVTLMLPLGWVVHASDASFVIAQTLPGQLPGQKLPGQLPGLSPSPSKPATAPPAGTSSLKPIDLCCAITAINMATSVVTAREKSGGRRTIEIKATPAQVQNLRVGQDSLPILRPSKPRSTGRPSAANSLSQPRQQLRPLPQRL